MHKLILLGLFLPYFSYSQTFTGGSGPIYDNQTIDIPVNVIGLPSGIDTVNFGLETICINATHTWDADLSFWIVAPDGTAAQLFSGVGGGDDNFTNTCLNQNASQSISNGTAPFTGTFAPNQQMGSVNNGQNPNGIWYLRVNDNYGADEGQVLDFTLTFGSDPASYFSFKESWLPIVKINTQNQLIQDEPKITALMKIIDNGIGVRNHLNDAANDYNGAIGIELRGSSSQSIYPKKSYGFETWDSIGNSLDSSILGMPAENDWVLISAYSDKTLMRNPITHETWKSFGRYAPRGKLVDLVINNDYQGVYWLGEKIKRDKFRLDIAKLDSTDTSGVDLTGGYIVKVDKLTGSNTHYWQSLFPAPNAPSTPVNIIVHYPAEQDLLPQQFTYIHQYIDSFEIALNGPNFQDTLLGWRRFASEKSFIDYFILNEFNRNVDAFRSSCYFYKDKITKGGKLRMGPTWDYDLSFGNGDFCDGWKTTGWTYQFNYVCGGDSWVTPFWWEKLMQDSLFQINLRCRWNQLRMNELNEAYLFQRIDSIANLLNESQDFNYKVWPIMGQYVWPNAHIAASYSGEIDSLKTWISARLDFLDANIPNPQQACSYLGIEHLAIADIKLYPNPCANTLHLKMNNNGQTHRYTILSQDGKIILSGSLDPYQETIQLTNIQSGIYFFRVDEMHTLKFVKE